MRSFYIKILIITSLTFQAFSCSHLGKNEVAKVKFELYGDFGAEQSELTIFETDGNKKARLITKGVGSSEIIFGDKEEQAFNKFLSSIKGVSKQTNYCTTEQHCSVYTNDETIEKKSIDCSWEGFWELKTALFKAD